uniref:Uncharacterized protein n=1 Tax=Knipowitschia caucasica TaxID=637954 RepID=A0AAV2JAB6_KNICA
MATRQHGPLPVSARVKVENTARDHSERKRGERDVLHKTLVKKAAPSITVPQLLSDMASPLRQYSRAGDIANVMQKLQASGNVITRHSSVFMNGPTKGLNRTPLLPLRLLQINSESLCVGVQAPCVARV